jgi:hypothetical protein
MLPRTSFSTSSCPSGSDDGLRYSSVVQTVRLISLAAFAVCFAAGQSAEGYIKIGSDRRELRYARAARVADDLDKSKQMLHLILSEAEIPSKALFDRGELLGIKYSKTNQIVEFNFHDNAVNWFLMSKEMEGGGTLSRSESPNPFPYEVSGDRVKGKVEVKSGQFEASTNHPPYQIEVTYSAVLEKAPFEVAPTPADAIAATRSPAAIAYLDFVSALRAGDKAKIMAGVPPAQRAQMDTPEFPKALKFIQMMMPSNLKILKAVEKDGEATLTLSGTLEGAPQKGEAIMKLEGGKWLLRSESWTNN